jgi:small subunit ribosomal protein S16
MPTKIRLARHGKKSRPYYYVVVTDSRAPRDGKFIERIGSYNPVTNPATIELDFDKALSWLQKGALPTDTVRSLLQTKGVLYKNHLIKGVAKGALTEEQAEKKFQDYMETIAAKLKGVSSKMEADKREDAKQRMAQETKVKEARAAALAKKNAKEAAAAHAAVEVEAEAEAEAPAAETEEAPAAE